MRRVFSSSPRFNSLPPPLYPRFHGRELWTRSARVLVATLTLPVGVAAAYSHARLTPVLVTDLSDGMRSTGWVLALIGLLSVLFAGWVRSRRQSGTNIQSTLHSEASAPDGEANTTSEHSDRTSNGSPYVIRSSTKKGTAASIAPSSIENRSLNLKLLHHLSDGTPRGLARQITVYLDAFDSDRRNARIICEAGDRKRIHQTAHRLVAHAAVLDYQPLVELATTMQVESAVLTGDQLDRLLDEFDREFTGLRNKLDELRASTEHG